MSATKIPVRRGPPPIPPQVRARGTLPPPPAVGAETELFTKWLADTGGFPMTEAPGADPETAQVRLRADARPWLLGFGALCILTLIASALGLALQR